MKNLRNDFEKIHKNLLEEAQSMRVTKSGLNIIRGFIDHLPDLIEQKAMQNSRRTPEKIKILLQQPYNQMSVIEEYLGLTGLGGLVIERLNELRQPIKCLINVTYELPLIRLTDMETYRIPVADNQDENIAIYFDEITEKIESMKRNNHSTVVHCMAGVSRSVTIVMAYLIRFHQMTVREAFIHIKRIRPFIRPNPSFLEQLVFYEWKYSKNLSLAKANTKIILIEINQIVRKLPDFIIENYLEEYKYEFENDQF
ncbi:dual specificity protein phosphatase 14-like protein-like protein [Sarcoptes scabiei]|uniref:Dual specificity protein phosphatase 14-like protein-like protein n=1 Tax=Sarcoptes scabiei TaxID=52283 RepID=A0A132AIY9_SARSC|nr:dual specificity protein phosphatase 14-like protein-like protein [Sarcoptes scabiei]